jgi:uncharacterized protein (UPF0332 family)
MERQDKIELSKVRLERSRSFLKASIANANMADYLTSANRSYYAVYYAIRALLILEHTEMAKHSGNISEFRRHYLKTGIFKAEVLNQLEHAKEIVDTINMYLEAQYAN